MGKLIYALLLVLFIEISILYFGGSGLDNNNLTDIFLNPQNLIDNPLYATTILIALTTLALSIILPGNFIQVNIYALYAGVAFVLVAFIASIVHLYSFLYGSLRIPLGESLTELILGVVVVPLVIFYMVAILEWVRSNN